MELNEVTTLTDREEDAALTRLHDNVGRTQVKLNKAIEKLQFATHSYKIAQLKNEAAPSPEAALNVIDTLDRFEQCKRKTDVLAEEMDWLVLAIRTHQDTLKGFTD